MTNVPDIIRISDLRQDAASALRRVRDSQRPVVITQRGRAAAILLSIDAYEASERERQILRLLARGEREIAAGSGNDLDAILAEADAFLARCCGCSRRDRARAAYGRFHRAREARSRG